MAAGVIMATLLTACSGSKSAPTITSQPESLSTVVGRTVEIDMTAKGKPSPDYLWYKDGTAITSQTTDTCTISEAKLSDAGDYTVVVSNSQGSVTSNAATLTVLPVPDILHPFGIAIASDNTLYVSDSVRHTVHKVTSDGTGTVLAGTLNYSGSTDATGTSAKFYSPQGLALDEAGTYLYVADYDNDTIRRVDTSTGEVTTFAGSAGVAGSLDATGTAARFYHPVGLAFDATYSYLYVSDSGNHTIRRISMSDVSVSTFAGTAGTAGSTNGSSGLLSSPNSLAVDGSGNVYVADYGNSVIRKITSTGILSTLAGDAGDTGTADGTGTSAHFYWPVGLAINASGDLLVADTHNHAVRKITTAGVVTTFAGTKGSSGNEDDTGTDAYFYLPMCICVDSTGVAYVTDYGNSLIRTISTAKVVGTVTSPVD